MCDMLLGQNALSGCEKRSAILEIGQMHCSPSSFYPSILIMHYSYLGLYNLLYIAYSIIIVTLH